MANYAEFLASARKTAKGTNYSRGDFITLVAEAFNDPETEIKVYSKKNDTFEEKVYHPSADLRQNFLAPILRSFGVDKAELVKVNDVQTSRSGAESLANFSLLMVKSYMSKKHGLGRKLTLPALDPNETIQSISTEHVEQEAKKTMAITSDGAGSYKVQPTGNIVTTEAHEKVKVTNRVPAWIKHSSSC